MITVDQIQSVEPLEMSDVSAVRVAVPFSRRIQRLANDQALRAHAIAMSAPIPADVADPSQRGYHGANNWIARARRQVTRAD